jgi:hypothetical protein
MHGRIDRLSAKCHIGGAESLLPNVGDNHMSSLDFDVDLDTQMSHLEARWRHAYEASIVARTDYQILAASSKANAGLLDMARERLDRTEALKAHVMMLIERLENSLLSWE